MQMDLTPWRRARGQVRDVERIFVLPAGPTPLGGQVRLAEPAQVRVNVHGGSREVDVAVAADLQLVCPCDRCLDSVDCPLTVAYGEHWLLAPRGATDGVDEPEDDGYEAILTQVGPVADLDDGFWQTVALELPTKVLCAKGCRGLCPHCGANRNRMACDCHEAPAAGSMAALAQWRPQP